MKVQGTIVLVTLLIGNLALACNERYQICPTQSPLIQSNLEREAPIDAAVLGSDLAALRLEVSRLLNAHNKGESTEYQLIDRLREFKVALEVLDRSYQKRGVQAICAENVDRQEAEVGDSSQ